MCTDVTLLTAHSVKESMIYRSKLGKPEDYRVWGLGQKEWCPPQTLPCIDDKFSFQVSQYKMRILWTESTDRVVVRKWERVRGGSRTHGGLSHFIQQCWISGTNLGMTWALVFPGNRDRRGGNSKARERENLRKPVTRQRIITRTIQISTPMPNQEGVHGPHSKQKFGYYWHGRPQLQLLGGKK